MKLKYNAPKRLRLKSQFCGITTVEQGWWFSYNTHRWERNPKAGKEGFSSHQPCSTMKAFRRKLKKAPQGVSFILVSRWVGYDIEGTGSLDYSLQKTN